MSQEDLYKALGRYNLDLAFSAGMQTDAEGTLKAAGYNLEPQEREQLKNMAGLGNASQPDTLVAPEPPGSGMPFYGSPFQPPPELMKSYWEEQYKNMLKMGELRLSLTEKAIDVVKKTFDRAGMTFSSITWMNRVMFAVGIGLFVFAAYLSVSTHAQVYSLLFGGLGATSFVTLFVNHPIEGTQKALANLVQVQVVFMTFFDQMTWWEGMANMSQTNPPDPSKIERASAGLQQRTLETLELLQRFVEEARSPKQRKKEKEPHKLDGHPAARQTT